MIADIQQVQETPKKSKFARLADALGLAVGASNMAVNIGKAKDLFGNKDIASIK